MVFNLIPAHTTGVAENGSLAMVSGEIVERAAQQISPKTEEIQGEPFILKFLL